MLLSATSTMQVITTRILLLLLEGASLKSRNGQGDGPANSNKLSLNDCLSACMLSNGASFPPIFTVLAWYGRHLHMLSTI